MWPKVFTQLVELLPHISRLIPMADLFFQTKSASEKASQTALSALAEDVRTDLTRVTSAHEGLYRQLQAQGSQLGEIAADVSHARALAENLADRLTAQERQIATLKTWIIAALLLLILVLAGLAAVLIRIGRP